MIDNAEVDRRADELAPRLDSVRARMAAAGGADVALLAVCKGHPVEAAAAAVRLGLDELGENYAQELAAKSELVPASWHFIGQLQSNKVRRIADRVAVWQSVDRIKVGREIAKHSPGATVFAQVNLADDAGKAGCGFDEVDTLVDQLRDLGLDVAGLMGVGAASDDAKTASGFVQLRAAVDHHQLTHCSMGMSADLELAIREGSTMVRIGSDLFGPRPALRPQAPDAH